MKEYSNNKEEKLDIHFRDKFDDFEETPNHDVWENIAARVDIEGFDKIFNSKLAVNEQTPSPEVWEKVQEGIPLNLFVKKHLENLMKIAAALLCIMSLTMYFTMGNQSSSKTVALNNSTPPVNEIVETAVAPVIATEAVEEKEDFVYEIKKKKKKRKKVKKKAEKEQDVDVDALWKLLMEDDDEFADVIDEEKKLKILTPPVRLPLIEETIAMAADVEAANTPDSLLAESPLVLLNEEAIAEATIVEPDLKIWVPLVVVEKHEIEKLINIYDEAQASKRINSLSNQ